MEQRYILGDWGTSSARFYLLHNDDIIDSVTAPGIKFIEFPEAAYFDAVGIWLAEHGPLTSVLNGMVGSNIGWKEAGYIECPASLTALIGRMISISHPRGDIHIVPGVKTVNSFTQQPDVMRGEEVQVFGWASQHKEDGLLCLPGTHTKWVQYENGSIGNFVSSLNGELFQVLSSYSILLGAPDNILATIGNEFQDGVEIGASGTGLNQLLFSTRSRQINGDYNAKQAKSYLLGLLIGSDVRDGLKYSNDAKVNIIGASAPAGFYAEAFRILGKDTMVYDGQEASLQGLRTCYKSRVRQR